MRTLFNQGEPVTRSQSLSAESFVSRYQTLASVSTEDVSDFLAKMKDAFAGFTNKPFSESDKIYLEVTGSRHETLNYVRRLRFVDVKDMLVSRPEGFQGKFTDYALTLVDQSSKLFDDVEKSLEALHQALGRFINDYKDSSMMTIYGLPQYKSADKHTAEALREVGQYFSDKTQGSKTTFASVARNLSDVEALYKTLEALERHANFDRLSRIRASSKKCADLVDALITMNVSSQILTKNAAAKKALVGAIHTVAREVEAAGYLYANATLLYGCFANLCKDIKTAAQ